MFQFKKFALLLLFIVVALPSFAKEVGKWKRFQISITNESFSGNPFDLDLQGVFVSPSGRKLTQLGFYHGEKRWTIFFMPDEVGEWSYRTESSDKELDGHKGTFTCVVSDLPGMLYPKGNQWALKDKGVDFPVIWNPPVATGEHWGFRHYPITHKYFQDALTFADETVGARVLGIYTLMVVPTSWAEKWPEDAVPYVRGHEGEIFNLTFWDSLNHKLDAVRDRGMGTYLMIYTDDALAPDRYGITPKSKRELRLLRYTMARLACYPIILWDSGIDIGEYRSNEWVNWFCQWVNEHDPWKHPVSSRTGGGSGGTVSPNATYLSLGGAEIPSREYLLELYEKDRPVAHTDHWRPFISRGNWNHDKIRIAMWRCGLSGAQALFPDYNQGEVKFDEVKLGGKYVGAASHFFQNELKYGLANLKPDESVIAEGKNAIASVNPGKEMIVYDEDGGEITLDIKGFVGEIHLRTYNPRTGEFSDRTTTKAEDTIKLGSTSQGKKKDLVYQIWN